MTDYKKLCAELVDELEGWVAYGDEIDIANAHVLIDRARAAVSEVVGPTVMEILELADQTKAAELGQIDLVRAALARWGHPAPEPVADGEVGELVAELRGLAEYFSGEMYSSEWIDQLTRAADLLERQAAPVPVAVSERLPGVRDCAPWPGEPDASAWCWVGSDVDGGWSWEQRSAGCLAAFPDDFTHWLPAHALPLPSGEVE